MPEEFTFQHIETEEDIAQNLEVMRQVFGQNTGVDLLVNKLIRNHPKMTLKNHFIIKHHGRTVASLNLIPADWSIGGVPLKVAEMGCVATLKEHRNQDLMQILINEYHKTVTAQDYDLSAIEGIPYFYRQFGYEYALPLDEETIIPLEKLPVAKSQVRIRPFTDADMPKAAELLATSQRKFYIHSIRDAQIWKMQQGTGIASEHSFEAYAVEEGNDVIAYFRISRRPEERKLILREATDASPSVTNAILNFLREIGASCGLETLAARTSYHDPVTMTLAKLGAEQIPPYAWQIRITNCVDLLLKMKPILESRLAASEYRGLTDKLNLNFRLYKAQIAIENGKIASIQRLDTDEQCIIGLNPPASTQLLLGYRERGELETWFPDFNVRPSHRRLIDVLFPKLPSYIHIVY